MYGYIILGVTMYANPTINEYSGPIISGTEVDGELSKNDGVGTL